MQSSTVIFQYGYVYIHGDQHQKWIDEYLSKAVQSYVAMLDGSRQWLLFSDAIMDGKRQRWTSLLHNDPI